VRLVQFFVWVPLGWEQIGSVKVANTCPNFDVGAFGTSACFIIVPKPLVIITEALK
jgi:hypothetical protein